MHILDQIVATKRAEVAARKRALLLDALQGEPRAPLRDFTAALRRGTLAAICEIKRKSPSKGPLRANLDVREIAGAYGQNGAAALSVLTDAQYFGGSEADLVEARIASKLPTLRKDFTIDAYQIYEARRLGADAVLLIVRILSDAQIREFLATARDLGLAALVETHDEREVERAVDCGAEIIGVNNRDLDTFRVSLDTSLRLRPLIPPTVIAVAESGIDSPNDVAQLVDAGFHAMLVGEALVRADDPGARLHELLSAAGHQAKP